MVSANHHLVIVSVCTFRQAWDLALDQCLCQLPVIIKDESKYKNSSFFSEQLTAFQVWLAMGNSERDPPEQLPIMLQVSFQFWSISFKSISYIGACDVTWGNGP